MSHDDPTTTDYPRDRFDDVEPYTTQQGAHRREFTPPKGAGHLNAIILAGGVALAIGVGSFLWLYPSDPLNADTPQPTETQTEPVDDPQDEPEEPEAVEEEEPDESQAGIDYELPVRVYNAANRQGYTTQVAQDLGTSGFNVSVADTWSNNVPAQNTVYFSQDETTALAVANEVGAVTVHDPSVEGVVVVLTAG